MTKQLTTAEKAIVARTVIADNDAKIRALSDLCETLTALAEDYEARGWTISAMDKRMSAAYHEHEILILMQHSNELRQLYNLGYKQKSRDAFSFRAGALDLGVRSSVPQHLQESKGQMNRRTIVFRGEEITIQENPSTCEDDNCPHWVGFCGFAESALSGIWLCWQCPVCVDTYFTRLGENPLDPQRDAFE